jgi:hypothetical protein
MVHMATLHDRMPVTDELPSPPPREVLEDVLGRYRRGAWARPLPPLLDSAPLRPWVVPDAYRPLVGHLGHRLAAHDRLEELLRPPGGHAYAGAQELSACPRTRRSALRVWLERTRPSHARGDRLRQLEAAAAGVRGEPALELNTELGPQGVLDAFDEEVDCRARRDTIPRLQAPAPVYGWTPRAFDPWDLLHLALGRASASRVRTLRLEAHGRAEPSDDGSTSRDAILLRPGRDRVQPGVPLGWSLFEDVVAQEWRMVARRLVGAPEALGRFRTDVSDALLSRSTDRLNVVARHALGPDLVWDPFAPVRAIISAEDAPWALRAALVRRHVHDAPWNALRGLCRAWRACLFGPDSSAYDHGVPLSEDIFESLLQARPLAVALDHATLSGQESETP